MVTQKLGGVIISPRTGRPKSENPKSYSIQLRIDNATKEALERYCEEHNEEKARVARIALEKFLGLDK